MEVDDVRHHRRADDPDGEEHALRPVEARDEPARDVRARRARHEHLQRERADDDADQRRDHRLEPPEPARLQREDRERGRSREQRSGKERDVEEELETDRGADELGDVRRHRDALRLDPEQDVRAAREPVAADLWEVLAGRDAELRAHRLDEHRHEVRGEDDPEQEVAELRPGSHVRREVPRVDVGDGCDEGGAEEGPEAAHPAAPARERLLCGVRGPGPRPEGRRRGDARARCGRVRARPTVLASRLRRPARPPPCSRNPFPSPFR